MDVQQNSKQAENPFETAVAGGLEELSHLADFCHVPHPHIAVRHAEGPVKVKDQLDRSTPIARLNSHLALLITLGVGSMWCAYIFGILAFVSFPSAISSGNTIIIVAWVAQTFLQLVLLPVIIVGQNIQATASDKRAQQTYNDAEAVLHEALQIQEHLTAQDQHLIAQDARLQAIIAALQKAYPAMAQSPPAPTD
jgi:hypothetical protein